MLLILLFLISTAIGTLSSMIGIGGGSLLIPALILLFNIPIHLAVSVSLLAIVFISISSVLVYSRSKTIDYKIGLVITVTSGLGAFIGAFISLKISAELLQLFFGIALILVGILIATKGRIKLPSNLHINGGKYSWERKFVNKNGELEVYHVNLPLVLSLTFLGGLYSGILGLGGGTLFVPILHIACGFDIHLAVGTSMFIILSTSIFGSTGHILQGNIDVYLAIPTIIGYIIGAQVGSRISTRSSSKTLKRIFGCIMIIIALRVILGVVL
ncbi:MAG: sulfite exporter TauE/SafE family protein [Candidatus Odinarchaeia archaeon]